MGLGNPGNNDLALEIINQQNKERNSPVNMMELFLFIKPESAV